MLTDADPVRLVNLTPHEIMLLADDGTTLTLPPSGLVARREVTRRLQRTLGWRGIRLPVSAVAAHRLQGLPEPAGGIVFVVSRMVAEAAPEREDVVFPDLIERSLEGRPVACRGLARVAPGTAPR